MANIGEPVRRIVRIEPEVPIHAPEPVRAPERAPEYLPEPEKTPEREPEKVH
jgi:hypothetical protein